MNNVETETYYFKCPMSVADVGNRCWLASKDFYRTLPDRLTSIMSTIALPAFLAEVEAGEPPTVETFTSILPASFRHTLDLVRESVLSASFGPTPDGQTFVVTRSGRSGSALLHRWLTLTETARRSLPDTQLRHVAVVTHGGVLTRLESVTAYKLVPSLCHHDYLGSEYEDCMAWSRESLPTDALNQVNSALCLALLHA